MSVQALSWAFRKAREDIPDTDGCKASTAKWVLVTLANYANANDEAYPDPDTTVAADTLLSPRAVGRALSRLVDLGLISDSKKREGRTGRIPVWKLNRRNTATVASLAETAGVDAGQGDESWRSPGNTATLASLAEGESGHGVQPNAATLSGNGATVSDPPITPQVVEPSGTVLDEPKDLSPAERRATFDRFWSTYPLRVGKRKAVDAFSRALRRADPDVIVDGARRYRDDPNRLDGFTAHPTTWLNRDGWEDEPIPARDPGPPTPPPARRLTAGEVARRHREAVGG